MDDFERGLAMAGYRATDVTCMVLPTATGGYAVIFEADLAGPERLTVFYLFSDHGWSRTQLTTPDHATNLEDLLNLIDVRANVLEAGG